MIEYAERQNTILVSGELLFKNAADSLQQWELLKPQVNIELILDCTHIVKADSSFLAILIEMRCWAHKKDFPFKLHKLPGFIKSFLTVYGIEELLMTPTIVQTELSGHFLSTSA